ncbi:DUF2478 domain-containing protein [Paracoccus saliphilus]|uniref:DUF2478 domain-containing protein n=1 Tax=Paracoccus saliphilus TaxID=405559 RepID=A0AA46A4Z9_9RHOB|nr:DUF2478 domain-containing protein [Paracoccus saliphilus]WCR04969.1 DUF2478 domain-containing protein [Paracoccus saliphilus]SIS71898.1 Protein of unknown function [Paracoccus saliphilus]
MLGWFQLPEGAPPGAADRRLQALVRELSGEGLRLAGAVQVNRDRGPDCACDMDIQVIGEEDRPIRISQSLGSGSAGCRLDPGALETAAARVEARLAGAELLILPKFGKQEAVGRGFCSVIGQAILDGVPVLLHVSREQRPAFAEFSGDLAEGVDPDALASWCRRQLAGAR